MLQIENINRNSSTSYTTTIAGANVSINYTYTDAAPDSVGFNANKQVDSTNLSLYKQMNADSTFSDSEKALWGESFCTTALLLVAATFTNYLYPENISVEEVVDAETTTSETA